MVLQVSLLEESKQRIPALKPVTLTKLGQNKLMFWMETKPTSNVTGKSQNNVNPL